MTEDDKKTDQTEDKTDQAPKPDDLPPAGGFGMHANRSADTPPADSKTDDAPKLDNLPPEDEFGKDAVQPDAAPQDAAPKLDNLPPEDEFGSGANKQAEAPKLDNLPPEDEFGKDAYKGAEAPKDSAPKLDNLPPDDIYGGHAGNPAEGSTQPVSEEPTAPKLDNLPPEDEFGAPPPSPDAAAPSANPAPPLPDPADAAGGETPKPFIRVEDDGGERNVISKGVSEDITRASPHLAEIVAAAGWEQAAIEEQKIDIDLSVFFLDRNDKTRVDEDFIFYNNEDILDGAVVHTGDNRTGAGEGDDEAVYIRLKDVPFDVLKIVFVLSIYDDDFQGHNFSMVRDVFFRVIDKAEGREIFYYPINEEDLTSQTTAVQVAELYREGEKWMVDTKAVTETGGLAKVATDYGIVVKEMQSVDLNVADEDSKL